MMIDCNNDSKEPTLPLDLVRSILERLRLVDFLRARCVSSTWYYASKSCNVGKNPLLILFPNEHNNKNSSCKLFDPHDNKTYTIRDLGFDLAKSSCLASSGSWFLILDRRTDFHLLNLFTRERIRLPSIESIDSMHMQFERISDSSDFRVSLYYKPFGYFFSGNKASEISIGKAALWIDENSKDYLVVWNYDCFFAYHKKSDDNKNTWKVFQPLKNQGCVNMVFKQNKLYVLSRTRNITVYDFSFRDDHDGSLIECASFQVPLELYRNERLYNKILAVTLSGEVLIINAYSSSSRCLFPVFKMGPISLKWSKIKSIGDEILLLDLGITVIAKEAGVMRNCIYFSNDQSRRANGISLCKKDNRICVYDIQTKNVIQEFQHLTASLPISLFKDARWFLPTFGGKCLQ